MKTKLILLLFVIVAACSCSKTKVNTVTNTVDTTVTTVDTPFETPVKSLLTQGRIIDSLDLETVSNLELGNEFYASENGTISKLGCICPTKNQAYRVSLWNFTTNNILATVTVTPTDSLHFFYTSITPVTITANTLYMVSINTTVNGSFLPNYFIEQKGDPTLPFPFSSGDITLLNEYFSFSPITVFPDNNENDFIAPADFVFKAN
jgi:hypothetical protein